MNKYQLKLLEDCKLNEDNNKKNIIYYDFIKVFPGKTKSECKYSNMYVIGCRYDEDLDCHYHLISDSSDVIQFGSYIYPTDYTPMRADVRNNITTYFFTNSKYKFMCESAWSDCTINILKIEV